MGDQAGKRRVAVVTGAARGIGAAVAVRLARDGLAIGVVDLDADSCAATVGGSRRQVARRCRWPRTSPTRRR